MATIDLRPTGSAKSLCAMACARYLKLLSGDKSYRALEIECEPRLLGKNKKGLRNKPTNKLYQHATGKSLPTEKHIKRAADVYPGSERIYYHPFWKIIDDRYKSMPDTFDLLETLPDNITFKLFYYTDYMGVRVRKRWKDSTFLLNHLEEMSNLDALTACFGLMRQAEYDEEPGIYNAIAESALLIFIRLYSVYPYSIIFKGFYPYLYNQFFYCINKQHIYTNIDIDPDNDQSKMLSSLKASKSFVLNMFTELEMINPAKEVESLGALYFWDTNDGYEVINLYDYRKIKQLRQHPFIDDASYYLEGVKDPELKLKRLMNFH